MAMHLLGLWKRGFVVFDLLQLRREVDTVSFQFIDPLAFAQTHIVEMPSASQYREQVLFLCRSWVKAVAVRFEHHNIISTVAHFG